MVRDHVFGCLEEVRGCLVENLTLEGDGLGKDVVEGRYSVRCDQDETIFLAVRVAHLAAVAISERGDLSVLEGLVKLFVDEVVGHLVGD